MQQRVVYFTPPMKSKKTSRRNYVTTHMPDANVYFAAAGALYNGRFKTAEAAIFGAFKALHPKTSKATAKKYIAQFETAFGHHPWRKNINTRNAKICTNALAMMGRMTEDLQLQMQQ